MKDCLHPGDVLCSTVSHARFLVVDPGSADAMPAIDGVALRQGKPRSCSEATVTSVHCELQGGRRYADAISGLTVMCIWPGRGSLLYEGRPLTAGTFTEPTDHCGVAPRSRELTGERGSTLVVRAEDQRATACAEGELIDHKLGSGVGGTNMWHLTML